MSGKWGGEGQNSVKDKAGTDFGTRHRALPHLGISMPIPGVTVPIRTVLTGGEKNVRMDPID